MSAPKKGALKFYVAETGDFLEEVGGTIVDGGQVLASSATEPDISYVVIDEHKPSKIFDYVNRPDVDLPGREACMKRFCSIVNQNGREIMKPEGNIRVINRRECLDLLAGRDVAKPCWYRICLWPEGTTLREMGWRARKQYAGGKGPMVGSAHAGSFGEVLVEPDFGTPFPRDEGHGYAPSTFGLLPGMNSSNPFVVTGPYPSSPAYSSAFGWSAFYVKDGAPTGNPFGPQGVANIFGPQRRVAAGSESEGRGAFGSTSTASHRLAAAMDSQPGAPAASTSSAFGGPLSPVNPTSTAALPPTDNVPGPAETVAADLSALDSSLSPAQSSAVLEVGLMERSSLFRPKGPATPTRVESLKVAISPFADPFGPQTPAASTRPSASPSHRRRETAADLMDEDKHPAYAPIPWSARGYLHRPRPKKRGFDEIEAGDEDDAAQELLGAHMEPVEPGEHGGSATIAPFAASSSTQNPVLPPPTAAQSSSAANKNKNKKGRKGHLTDPVTANDSATPSPISPLSTTPVPASTESTAATEVSAAAPPGTPAVPVIPPQLVMEGVAANAGGEPTPATSGAATSAASLPAQGVTDGATAHGETSSDWSLAENSALLDHVESLVMEHIRSLVPREDARLDNRNLNEVRTRVTEMLNFLRHSCDGSPP